MKFIVFTILLGLIGTTIAHPPPSSEEQKDEKPVTESTTTTTSTSSPSTSSPSLLSSSAEETADEKLPVTIYYEGLCPDSRKLMADLGREYYIFRKYVALEFVPFGRAKSLDADGNEFECHHGPKECVSNRVHSCGIKYLKSQDAKQQFVVCQMRTEADQTGKECLEEAGGNWTKVSKCVDGNEGKKLQLEAEVKTKRISEPKLESVPTIVFNNSYSSEVNTKAMKGLKTVFCQMLSAKNIPDCE